MHTPTGCVLSRTLKKLDEFERLGLFSPAVIAERRLEYFKKHRLTCTRCTKRSQLYAWEFVRTFERMWHKNIGFGAHKGMGTFEPRATQFCLVRCPHCLHAHTVQYLPEWRYITTAIDTYKLSPAVLFANYALQPVAPHTTR